MSSHFAVAVIDHVRDPQGQGRVHLSFPDGSAPSGWARVARRFGPSDGDDPLQGDQVVVAFEHGDVAAPIVLGLLGGQRAVRPRRV